MNVSKDCAVVNCDPPKIWISRFQRRAYVFARQIYIDVRHIWLHHISAFCCPAPKKSHPRRRLPLLPLIFGEGGMTHEALSLKAPLWQLEMTLYSSIASHALCWKDRFGMWWLRRLTSTFHGRRDAGPAWGRRLQHHHPSNTVLVSGQWRAANGRVFTHHRH